jgi:hypothetical protein
VVVDKKGLKACSNKMTEKLEEKQGDQIEQIFASRVTVYFGQNVESLQK